MRVVVGREAGTYSYSYSYLGGNFGDPPTIPPPLPRNPTPLPDSCRGLPILG